MQKVSTGENLVLHIARTQTDFYSEEDQLPATTVELI